MQIDLIETWPQSASNLDPTPTDPICIHLLSTIGSQTQFLSKDVAWSIMHLCAIVIQHVYAPNNFEHVNSCLYQDNFVTVYLNKQFSVFELYSWNHKILNG